MFAGEHRGAESEERAEEAQACEGSHTFARAVGWISVAAGAIALGFYVGRQLRARYNFNRRTPYDFYSHAGDEQRHRSASGSAEYGVGI
jgi:hypothetical protein